MQQPSSSSGGGAVGSLPILGRRKLETGKGSGDAIPPPHLTPPTGEPVAMCRGLPHHEEDMAVASPKPARPPTGSRASSGGRVATQGPGGVADGGTTSPGDLGSPRLECTACLRGHTGPVTAMVVSGGRLFTASSDATICVWDLVTNLQQPYSPLCMHRDGVKALAASSREEDGSSGFRLYSGGDGGEIHSWGLVARAGGGGVEVRHREALCQGRLGEGSVNALAVVAAGSSTTCIAGSTAGGLCSGGEDSSVLIWEDLHGTF